MAMLLCMITHFLSISLLIWLSFSGKFGIRDGGKRWLQAEILGAEGEEKLSIHRVQDRWEGAASNSGNSWGAWSELWKLHLLLPSHRVSICCLRFRLHYSRECSKEQDLLHCLVKIITLLQFHSILMHRKLFVWLNPWHRPQFAGNRRVMMMMMNPCRQT